MFTVGANYRTVGNTIDGRYEACVRRCQNTYAQGWYKIKFFLASFSFSYFMQRVPKQPSLSALYTLSSHATHEAVHLLCQMLVFDPVSSQAFVAKRFKLTLMSLSRIREYQLLMPWLIRTSTKVDYVTTRACVNAVIPRRVV